MNDLQKPSDADFENLWESVERELYGLVEQVDAVSAAAVARLFSHLEQMLQDSRVDYSCHAFTFTAGLLANRWYVAEIWDWWRKMAATLDAPHQRAAFMIACLEPIPEVPVRWDDVDTLLSFLADEETAWAVFEAYANEEFPQNLLDHYLEYSRRRTERGQSVPPFPQALLEAELKEIASCDVRNETAN